MCLLPGMRRRRLTVWLPWLAALLVLAWIALRAQEISWVDEGAVGGAPSPAVAEAPRLEGCPRPETEAPVRRGVEPPPWRNVDASIVGTVVDEHGTPVPGANIRLAKSPGMRAKVRTDADGRYRLPVLWKGARTLYARAQGYGTGSLEGVVVDRDGDAPAPPLVLRGAGWFSGVVVFPDGTPGDGVALEGEISLRRGGSWSATPIPGLAWSMAVADDEGRFRIGGLRPGPYEVEAPLLSDQAVVVDADHAQEDVRVVLNSHRIRVQVRDEDGSELPEVELKVTRTWGDRRGWGFSKPRRPDDVIELWGRPGARDVAHFRCKGYLPVERTFSFTEASWTRDEIVVLPREDGGRGQVALAVQREDGTWIQGLSVRLRSESDTYGIPRFQKVHADEEDVVDLPPGRWTLEVLPTRAFEDEYEGYDFPVRGPVQVRVGERRALSLRSHQGGRVRVHAKRGPGMDPEEDLTVGIMLQVSPEHPDAESLDCEDLGWFEDDEALLSEITEAGPWLLEVEGEGVRYELRPIVVRQGHTLDVHVTLVPDAGEADDED